LLAAGYNNLILIPQYLFPDQHILCQKELLLQPGGNSRIIPRRKSQVVPEGAVHIYIKKIIFIREFPGCSFLAWDFCRDFLNIHEYIQTIWKNIAMIRKNLRSGTSDATLAKN
jgi:hypothetical protein